MTAEMSDSQYQAAIEERARKVQELVAQKKVVDAILLSLNDPPVYSKNEAIKQANAQVVFGGMNACSKSDIKKVIEVIPSEAEDILMKYLYRGLGTPQSNGLLLEWHAQLYAKAGHGCIIRALTDRKTV